MRARARIDYQLGWLLFVGLACVVCLVRRAGRRSIVDVGFAGVLVAPILTVDLIYGSVEVVAQLGGAGMQPRLRVAVFVVLHHVVGLTTEAGVVGDADYVL